MFDPDVEEALLRVYGVDPHKATPRRVWSLLRRLPAGTWHKDNGPASWSNEAYLIAGLIDSVNQNTWVTVAANSKKKPKQPKPIPRPGTSVKKTKWSDLADSLGGVEGVVGE